MEIIKHSTIKQKLGMHLYPAFEVLIHSSEESLNNALYDIEPITISKGDVKKAMFTKTNLNSISTEVDPCADEETLTCILFCHFLRDS